MSTPDTPDYQRGVVSAQQLLATVAAGTAEVTVDVPPNAETLIVCVQEYPSSLFIRAVGVTTGVVYPTAYCSTGDGIVTWQAQFFDCSSPLDSKVQITCATAPSQPWYVYSDAAVHVVIDPISANAIGGTGAANPGGTVQVGGTDGTDLRTLRTSEQGMVYTVPSAPDTAAGDHPPNELLTAHVQLTASGNAFAAPGAGLRYRIFAAAMSALASGLTGWIYDLTATRLFLTMGISGWAAQTYGPTGIALSADSAITFGLNSGTGTTDIIIVYTVETV